MCAWRNYLERVLKLVFNIHSDSMYSIKNSLKIQYKYFVHFLSISRNKVGWKIYEIFGKHIK